MADNRECEVCGGTDFYKEAGYFYCNECQTQSQHVREHKFQEEKINVRGLRKIKKEQTEKLDDKITSWECYNFVMRSLSEQLINLGAKKNLKQIVKCLWIKYLQKLEVLHLKREDKPKLQLVNSRRDSNILYGVKQKKRKRKSSSDNSLAGLRTSSMKRERAKKKRVLAQADYENFSRKSTQDTSSLNNETLTSLKSASEKSEKNEEKICFNRYGTKELKKKVSNYHCRKHRLDKNRDLRCHKLTYDGCSQSYRNGIHFLSPIKLYCILYLGLLINRDEIQLGDLFRFIREGHLNFNNYKELLPEEYLNKFINIQNNIKNKLFSNHIFRSTTAQIAIFLNVNAYIKIVDLTTLCWRFCKEMNLPEDVYAAVTNIISKTNPKLTFTRKSNSIPNYEARVMSFILFILKLLFGLDGKTEWEMSKYAQSVNDAGVGKKKMFDIIKWMEYLGYRQVVINESHFPSQYLHNSDEIDSDEFLQYVKSQEVKFDESVKITKEMEGYKDLLTKIVEKQADNCNVMKFEPSLTPFLDYFQMLSSSKHNINYNFQNDSLDFLLRPNNYLHSISDNLEVKHGGANDNWIIEDLKSYRSMKFIRDGNLRLIPIELTKSGGEKDVDETINAKMKVAKKEKDPQHVQETYNSCRQHVFEENEIYMKRICKGIKLEREIEEVKNFNCYNILYNPHERYWMYLQMGINKFNRSDSELYFNKHPSTFKLVFNECARIIEQTTQELLYEYQYAELFLVFSADYNGEKKKQKRQKLFDQKFIHYINEAANRW